MYINQLSTPCLLTPVAAASPQVSSLGSSPAYAHRSWSHPVWRTPRVSLLPPSWEQARGYAVSACSDLCPFCAVDALFRAPHSDVPPRCLCAAPASCRECCPIVHMRCPARCSACVERHKYTEANTYICMYECMIVNLKRTKHNSSNYYLYRSHLLFSLVCPPVTRCYTC